MVARNWSALKLVGRLGGGAVLSHIELQVEYPCSGEVHRVEWILGKECQVLFWEVGTEESNCSGTANRCFCVQ